MLKLTNPATGEIFSEIEATAISDLTMMFENSQKAQKIWRKSSFEKRKEVLSNFCDYLLKDKLECARILTQEMGKPLSQSLSEIEATVPRVKWFIDNFESSLETKTLYKKGPVSEKISWDPLGVVLNISAWNFPYFIGTNVLVPALLTGNSVLYKPSEICSHTALKMRELLIKSGLDGDLFQVVIGEGSVGQTLLEFPLDGVFFTGSYGTGKKISSELGGKFIKSTMELGGKDAAYVCDDAPLEHTVDQLVDGVFYNAGQSCCSVERIYVHQDIYDKFVDIFTSKVSSLVMGDPMSEGTYLGPLARKEQISFLDSQKQDALEKGAREVVEGGSVKGSSGWFYKPSVFLEVDHSMSLMKDESFGPIVGIMKVQNDEEATSLMNDTSYGLTASVHTNSLERGEGILGELEIGTSYINFCDRGSPRLPWSGRRNSGMGSTLSVVGVREFLKPRSWQIFHG